MIMRMKVIVTLAAACWLLPASARSSTDIPVFPGERLTYVVEFMSMEIASIQLTVIERIDTLGTTLYHVRADISSNPGIPFVTIQDQYHSYFDSEFNSYYYYGTGLTRRHAFRINCVFDYAQARLRAQEFHRKGAEEKLHKSIDRELKSKFRDGLSMFYFLRYCSITAAPEERQTTPAFIGLKKAPIRFEKARKIRYVEVLDQKIATVPADIFFKFEGIGGIRGTVKLNYAADETALPVSGTIKAPIGTVKLRLVEYVPGKPSFVQTAKSDVVPAPEIR